jgi:hypothetical protein
LRSSHKGSGVEIADGFPSSLVEVLHEPFVVVGVGDDPVDVLDEEEAGVDFVCELEGSAPEVAPVFFPEPLASLRMRLARDSPNDKIHETTERSAWEGLDIVPDRSRSHGRVLHPLHEIGRSSSLPLDTTYSSRSATKEMESLFHSEVQSPDPRADREDADIPGT